VEASPVTGRAEKNRVQALQSHVTAWLKRANFRTERSNLIGAEARLKVLMMASLAGDAKAYRLLLDALGVGLRGYYRRRLNGADAADEEDLVQDTLIAMHTRRATYDPAQPFTAWVYAIARYKLIDHYRRHRIRRTVPLEDAGALFAEDETTAAIARLDLDRILQTLPPGTRELIRRTKIDGLSNADAGAAEGLSETAAKVRVHRGLKALADRFGKGGDDADG
jgi:RNA polymerase sigma-70 factor (ECF subfamily)